MLYAQRTARTARMSPAFTAGMGLGTGYAANGMPTPMPPAGNLLSQWQASSLTLTDGQDIKSWNDSTGNTSPLVLGGGAQFPTYKAAIINGYPVARFAANTALLGGPTVSSPYHVFFVANASGTGQGANGTIFSNNNPSGTTFITFNTGAGAMKNNLSGFSFTAPTSAFQVRSCKFNAASSTSLLNGAGDASGTVGTNGLNEVFLGCLTNALTGAFAGDLAELLIYNTALGSTAEQAVISYLGAKYGIAVT